MLLILLGRPKSTYWISVLVYFLFLSASVIKINFLNAPLMPIDLFQIDDLLRTKEVVLEYIGYFIVFLIISSLFIYYNLKNELVNNYSRVVALLSVIAIVVLLFSFREPIRLFLDSQDMLIKKNTNLINRSARNGYLNYFFQATVLQRKSIKPIGFEMAKVDSIINKYDLNEPLKVSQNGQSADNVIVILAESFIDPNEIGWQTSETILKKFSQLRSEHNAGNVIVPVYGGKSINSEFELMTGLSTLFTPIESLPYREMVSNSTPSLASVLSSNGFITNVVQLVPMSGFGFEKIYEYLGFDNVVSLVGSDINKDPTGKYASSKVLAEKIIKFTKLQNKSFIYAFANTSHMPWKISDYPENTIKLINNKNIRKKTKNRIIAYFNALRHVEELLVILVDYFTNSNQNTLILFVGDHHPSLKLAEYNNNFLEYENYKVPYLIWQNYKSIDENTHNTLISMNFLAAKVLEKSNVSIKGFFKFNHILMKRLKVVSRNYDFKDNLNQSQLELFQEYEYFQHRILSQ
ncbi:hypothetical protein GCM10011365_05490 [Marinicella pacifica]|uniref:Sulfatase N-terminal domain-containing protein n=1 Tax=Marinicella pacifica TaxID=1171543 RepID=A0A917CFD8_9GAMM|nr:LTA synthase family protein [Marinicella pacifica]GGF87323.1 hypothetical protein GCM10011365_05490 [Marinicella pacifica]